MKGRDRVGLIVCDFKPIPPALAQLLGDHLLGLDTLRIQWERLPRQGRAGQPRELAQARLQQLRGDGLRLASSTSSPSSRIAVNRLDFLMPLRSPDMPRAPPSRSASTFRNTASPSTGKIDIGAAPSDRACRSSARPSNFSPELCDLMSDYFFASSIAAKRA